jgi:hypothetical protein
MPQKNGSQGACYGQKINCSEIKEVPYNYMFEKWQFRHVVNT